MGTFKITAWLYRSKAKTTDKSPMYYRIALGDQRIKLSSGKLIDTEMWDEKTSRAISKYKGASQINKQIELDIQKLTQIYLQYREAGKEILLYQLKLEFLCRGNSSRPLPKVVDYPTTIY
jgi:Tol biopolymer transport system component